MKINIVTLQKAQQEFLNWQDLGIFDMFE